jgi:hypothetical protein
MNLNGRTATVCTRLPLHTYIFTIHFGTSLQGFQIAPSTQSFPGKILYEFLISQIGAT